MLCFIAYLAIEDIMSINESIPIERLAGRIQNASEQMIFAGVVALTRTAKHGQRAVQDDLPKIFIIRDKWTVQGIRITPATKQNQEAEVYSKDWYMPLHEEGGQRKSPKGFWIPVAIREAVGITSLKQKIPQWASARNLKSGRRKLPLANTKAFITTVNNTQGIYARIGKENIIRLLYAYRLEPITIKARPWFFNNVNKAYDKYLEIEYDKALLEAWAK